MVALAINALTDKHEQQLSTTTGQPAWRVSDAPTNFIEKLAHAIVGFEMTINQITGKRKLSQNQPQPNQDGVKDGLATLKKTQ